MSASPSVFLNAFAPSGLAIAVRAGRCTFATAPSLGHPKQEAQAGDTAFGLGELGDVDAGDLEAELADPLRGAHVSRADADARAHQGYVCTPRLILGNLNETEAAQGVELQPLRVHEQAAVG